MIIGLRMMLMNLPHSKDDSCTEWIEYEEYTDRMNKTNYVTVTDSK